MVGDREVRVIRFDTQWYYDSEKSPEWPIVSIERSNYVYYLVTGLLDANEVKSYPRWGRVLIEEAMSTRGFFPEGSNTPGRLDLFAMRLEDDDFLSCGHSEPEVEEYGCTCGECHEYYEYAVKRANFVCKGCQLRRSVFA
jgi:hypothetical protein